MITYFTENGSTSNILRFKIFDAGSTVGAGLTGLTEASIGLIISTIASNEATATTYAQASTNIETIAALGTFVAPTASKCRFKEIDATNHAGEYELQIADARFAITNAAYVDVTLSGFATMVEKTIRVYHEVDSNLKRINDGKINGDGITTAFYIS